MADGIVDRPPLRIRLREILSEHGYLIDVKDTVRLGDALTDAVIDALTSRALGKGLDAARRWWKKYNDEPTQPAADPDDQDGGGE